MPEFCKAKLISLQQINLSFGFRQYLLRTFHFAKHYDELRASRFFRTSPTAVFRLKAACRLPLKRLYFAPDTIKECKEVTMYRLLTAVATALMLMLSCLAFAGAETARSSTNSLSNCLPQMNLASAVEDALQRSKCPNSVMLSSFHCSR